VSHDLFEGVHGRAALATDIVLFEESPSHYAAWARRMHRWVRGDWQLVPWLLPRVPGARGELLPNRLQAIDRWKIVDNLRRSLAGPSIATLLVSGWTWLPGSALVWTLLALSALAAPVVPSLVESRSQRANTLSRLGMALVFLVHESAVVVDAIVRVTFRLCVTRRRLLQWRSAARTAQGLGRGSPRTVLWREMWASPSSSVVIAGLVGWAQPTAIVVAAPLLVAWCLAPELARWVSRPAPPVEAPLQEEDRRIFRRLARRTWLFFETFVGPSDQWLPVDTRRIPPSRRRSAPRRPTSA
jgi:cyclic beta-1,2-glucan synthetase